MEFLSGVRGSGCAAPRLGSVRGFFEGVNEARHGVFGSGESFIYFGSVQRVQSEIVAADE